jgi:Cu/Ag efflux pump CusA
VPLSQLADVRARTGESTVMRENGQRNLTIRIDNRERDLTSYLEEAQKKIAAHRSISTRIEIRSPVGRTIREPTARGSAAPR